MVIAAPHVAPSRLLDDPTIYPVHGDMGSNTIEILIRVMLLPLVARWLASRGKSAFVGSDQFIYYEPFNSKSCVAPDLYVHPGLLPTATPSIIKVWELGPPSFALEIVSEDKGKDYVRSPARYADVGVRELIIYDPHWQGRRDGQRFQVYATERGKGFVRVDATEHLWIPSYELGCCLREVQGPGGPLLRLATGSTGAELFPTEAEDNARKADENARRADERAAEADGARGAARQGVELVCELLGVALTEERRAALQAMNEEQLAALLAHLRSDRSWPPS